METFDSSHFKALSRYHLLLIFSAVLIVVSLWISPWCAGIIVILDLLIIAIAPFRQRLNLFLPIITRSTSSSNAISLTFDDGPDPVLTESLLDLLAKYEIKAAFFVVGREAANNPQLIKRIIREGHEIGNHSQNHDSLLMLRKTKTIYNEIAECQQELASLGVLPYAFRPPVGITNPKLFRILLSLGMYCIGFSRRPVDFGNRRLSRLKEKILSKIKAGDIVLLHDSRPSDAFPVQQWLDEVEALIVELGRMGLTIVPLSTLINRPVMLLSSEIPAERRHPLRAVFNFLAPQYNASNCLFGTTSSTTATIGFMEYVAPTDTVLDLGAGTGVQTLEIAKKSKAVTAVDISNTMLDLLEQKANQLKLTNIATLCANAATLNLNSQYDKICAFHCFEFVHDLGMMVRKSYSHLKQGGLLYFVVSDFSLAGHWLKLKTALTFGIRIHLRTKKSIVSVLVKEGFQSSLISTNNNTLIVAARKVGK